MSYNRLVENAREVKDFKKEFLNSGEIRQKLRDSFPGIERLESLEELSDLQLTRLHIANDGFPIEAHYKAIVTSDLYPVIEDLIETKVTNEKGVRNISELDCGTEPHLYKKLYLPLSPNINISLEIYNKS